MEKLVETNEPSLTILCRQVGGDSNIRIASERTGTIEEALAKGEMVPEIDGVSCIRMREPAKKDGRVTVGVGIEVVVSGKDVEAKISQSRQVWCRSENKEEEVRTAIGTDLSLSGQEDFGVRLVTIYRNERMISDIWFALSRRAEED